MLWLSNGGVDLATLKTTRKLYPQKFIEGFIFYHKTNSQVLNMAVGDKNFFFHNYENVKFFTQAQHDLFDRRRTWAWCKCHMSASLVLDVIKNTELADCIEHYSICTHDKDDSEPHTHMLIKFYRNESYLTKLIEYFHCDNISDPSHKLVHCFNYLIHNSKQCLKEGKYRYDESERITDNDVDFWNNLSLQEDNCKDTSISIVDDILSGVNEYELGCRYGREYILNRQRYRDFTLAVESQRFEDKLRKLHMEFVESQKMTEDEFFNKFVCGSRSIDIDDLKYISFGGNKNGNVD